MALAGMSGGMEGTSSALDIATRVEVQDELLDTLAEQIANVVGSRVDVQEAILSPLYKSLVRLVQTQLSSQAEMLSPVGRRVVTYLKGRQATTGNMLTRIAEEANLQPNESGVFTATSIPDNLVSASGSISSGVGGSALPSAEGNVLGPIATPTSVNLPVSGTSTQPTLGTIPSAPIPTGGNVLGAAPTPAIPNGKVAGFIPGAAGTTATGANLVTATPTPAGSTFGKVSPATFGIPTATPGECPPTPCPTPTPTVPEIPSVELPTFPQPRLNWCVPDPCAAADKEIRAISDVVSAPKANEEDTTDMLGRYLGWGGALGANSGWALLKRIVPGDSAEHLSVGAGETLGRMAIGVTTADKILSDLQPAGVADVRTVTAMIARLGAANMVAQETGIPLDYVVHSERLLLQYSSPQFIPSQQELDNARVHNRISDLQWFCLTRANGNIPECHVPVLEAQYRKVDILDLISLYRRGDISSKEQLYNMLQRVGVNSKRDMEDYLRSTLLMPTPSTIQHYNIRDVFDPNKLGRAEMEQEFKETKNLREMYDAVGMGKFDITTPTGEKIEVDQAWLDFLGSYEEMSPTQSYVSMHRFRPNRVHMFAQTIPNKKPDELRTLIPGSDIRLAPNGRDSIVTPKPFTLFEVVKNLKEKDYNPIHRVPLAASSFNTIGRIDLRRMYAIGVFGKPIGVGGFRDVANGGKEPIGPAEIELTERYKDIGYTDVDAGNLALYTATEYVRTKTGKAKASVLTRLCNAFKLGVLTKEELQVKIYETIGDDELSVQMTEQCVLDHRLAVVKQTIAATKSMYLRGEVAEPGAVKRLTDAGVNNARIRELIALWNIMLIRKDKDVTASQLCEWYNNGFIDRKKFKFRLLNIGYDDADADRIIRHCELGELAKSAKIRARQAAAAQKAKLQFLSADAKRAAEVEKAREERFMRFLKTRTEKNLKEWLQDGTITPGEVYTTLIQKGYSDADATRWLEHVRRGIKPADSGGETASAPSA